MAPLPIPRQFSSICVPASRIVVVWRYPTTPGVRPQTGSPNTFIFDEETRGSPKFPGYPFENMPCSKIPVVSRTLAIIASSTAAFSAIARDRLSTSAMLALSSDHNCKFRDSITRPAFLFPPAPDLPYGFCLWGSLLSCWLDFGLVGLGSKEPHPLDNNNQFLGF